MERLKIDQAWHSYAEAYKAELDKLKTTGKCDSLMLGVLDLNLTMMGQMNADMIRAVDCLEHHHKPPAGDSH